MKNNRLFSVKAFTTMCAGQCWWSCRCIYVVIASLALVSTPSYAQTSECAEIGGDIVGAALDAKTGELLYCEQHIQKDALNWRVAYSANGKIIAEKTLDYSSGEISPLVKQNDVRTGELRQVAERAGHWLLSYRPDGDSKAQAKTLSQEGVQVIDAGFDPFVRQQWQQLTTGRTVVFDFVSIPHLKSIALRAKTVAMDECKSFALTDDVDAHQCISVEANSGLLRLFVDRLVLLYDKQQRLRVFKGAVNIQNDEQETQDAIIYYRYPSRLDDNDQS